VSGNAPAPGSELVVATCCPAVPDTAAEGVVEVPPAATVVPADAVDGLPALVVTAVAVVEPLVGPPVSEVPVPVDLVSAVTPPVTTGSRAMRIGNR
jgi:hypothetical protein